MFVDDVAVPYVYTTGVKGAPPARQRASAAQDVRASGRPLPDADLIFGDVPGTWTDFFARVGAAARSGPVVVVLDEFPWMTESEPTLEGELQVQWDRLLEGLPVLLVLVGVGAWWNRDNSTVVDVVARGESGVLALGSVKWRGVDTFSRRDVVRLAQQRGVVPGAAEARLIAVVAEPSSAVPDVDATFDAHDLVQGWTT